MVRAYADGLARLGAQAKAEEVLYAAIKRQYDDRLVERYGRVQAAIRRASWPMPRAG